MKFITNKGNEKLLNATPLKPVTIKYVAAGSGVGPADRSIVALQDEKWRGNATEPKKEGSTLYFGTRIPSSTGGWWWNEWGLIDDEGDLIAYGKLDNPIYKDLNTMEIDPELPIALLDSVEANIVVVDALNWDHNKMTNRSDEKCHPIGAIDGLTERLEKSTGDIEKISTKMTELDEQNVKLTGAQTIAGSKTFSSTVRAPFFIGSSISLSGATETARGVIEIATVDEIKKGTDKERAITPHGLKTHMNITGDAPVFGVRAWANFDGNTGAMRASGNVRLINKSGQGFYQVDFITPMPNDKYSVTTSQSRRNSEGVSLSVSSTNTTGFTLWATYGGDNTTGSYDPLLCYFQVVC